MQTKELSIFSVFHKDYPKPDADFIVPIQVGKALTHIDLGFLKDDTGENISEKNPTFCELTALYWIWKNLDTIDSKYIGLVHYRRYFTLPAIIKKKKLFYHKYKTDPRDCYIKELSSGNLNAAVSAELKTTMLAQLHLGKLIVPFPIALQINNYHFNIKDNYIYHHIKEDWLLLEAAIKKVAPSYAACSDTYFETAQVMHGYNMFVGSKLFVKNYCDWLFPILAEVERTVKLSEYPYQKRLFGFMSERLLNLYINKNNMATAPYPVVFFQ